MRKFYSLLIALLVIHACSYSQSNAIQFTGTQYVEIPDNNALDITGDFTIEAWIYPTSFTAMGGIVSKYQTPSALGSTLRLSSTGNFRGISFNEMETADNLLQANLWQHIAATKQSGVLKVYINGIEQALTGTAMTVAANSDPLRIGVDYLSGGRYFSGKIDDVRIWNVVRSVSQIKANMYKKNISASESGLVALYNMDEGSGTTAANSCTNTTGINGTLINSPTWVASPVKYDKNGLAFDGINDYVTIADSPDLDITADFTFEAWIKPAVFSYLGGIVSKYQGLGTNGNTFRLSQTGNFRGISINAYETADNLLTANTWYHVAATRSGSTYTVYINGVSVPLTGSAMAVAANSDAVRIGVDYLDAGAPRYFNGIIDEVRIWNIARSGAQIAANMNNELDPAAQTGLIAYYTFNQGAAGGTNTGITSVIDFKNNHTGTLSNFALTGTTSNFTNSSNSLVALPVTWQYVRATAKQGTVSVNWSLSDCSGYTGFIVERSTNGVNWSVVTHIPTIQNKDAYTAIDYNQPAIKLYYRIIAEKPDGAKNYSMVVSTQAEQNNMRILQNPVSTQLVFAVETDTELQLVNNAGIRIWKKHFVAGNHSVNVSGLPGGVYYLSGVGKVIAVMKQ